ncbi:MAG: ferritin-like domain-containing protein [Pirellulales bacterium]
MNQSETIDALNELMALHYRSFPMYLRHAHSWSAGNHAQVANTLRHIVNDQSAMAERIASEVLSSGGNIDTGAFPLEFTDANDLSIDFQIRRAIECQCEMIDRIESCIERLRLAPAARELAEESLGMAKGHLESLEELSPQAA